MNPDVERLTRLAEESVSGSGAPATPVTEDATGAGGGKGIAAAQLVALAKDSGLQLFHDQFQDAYAWVVVHDSHQSLKIQSKRFHHWLVRLTWLGLKKAPSRETVQSAIQILAACARYDGPEYSLGTRVVRTSEAIWYDLGQDIVRVTATGWTVVPEPYPLFVRYTHQRPQVVPTPGGDLRSLLSLVNLPGRETGLSSDQLLVLVSLVLMIVPDIAHPVLCIHAEQGAGKTSLMRMLRALIDPSAAPTLGPPDSLREFVQLAAHHYLVFLDNLSTLPEWLSDTICRCVTGEGFSKRELFSDDEDILYCFRRSVGLNGINLVPSKPDLLDRSLILSLERIPDTHRQTEAQLWKTFEALKPRLLGAIFTLVSQVLATLHTITITRAPRLADFATYGVAAAKALGVSEAAFLDALGENSRAQTAEALQASPVAQALLVFLEGKPGWSGTATALLKELNQVADQAGVDQKSRLWPKEVRWVWRRIKEVRPNLLALGWQADHREVNGKAQIELVHRSLENDGGVPPNPNLSGNGGDQPGDSSPHHPDKTLGDADQNLLNQAGAGDTGDSGIIFLDSTGVDSTGWPIELIGMGPRETVSRERCHSCQEGTWQRYGEFPLCKRHALEALASQGGAKTWSVDCDRGKEGEGEENHRGGESSHG